MRLIVSAYRAEVNPWRNAQQTALLLQEVQKRDLLAQLVVGTYNGVRGVAVEVTGYASDVLMTKDAQHWLYRFDQTAVFAEFKDKGYLITKQGTEYIGKVQYTVGLNHGDAQRNHTQYMDGRVL